METDWQERYKFQYRRVYGNRVMILHRGGGWYHLYEGDDKLPGVYRRKQIEERTRELENYQLDYSEL